MFENRIDVAFLPRFSKDGKDLGYNHELLAKQVIHKEASQSAKSNPCLGLPKDAALQPIFPRTTFFCPRYSYRGHIKSLRGQSHVPQKSNSCAKKGKKNYKKTGVIFLPTFSVPYTSFEPNFVGRNQTLRAKPRNLLVYLADHMCIH